MLEYDLTQKKNSQYSAKEAGMAYEEARRRTEGADNSGLPTGFSRCRHPEVERLLGILQEAAIEFYIETRLCLNHDSPFFPDHTVMEIGKGGYFPDSRPINIEGYQWYGGVEILVAGGLILLLHPWMHPRIEGGAPDPIVYTTCGVRSDEVLEVIKHFSETKLRYMKEARKAA